MNIHELDAIEKQSIHEFVQEAADDGYLSGRVLDYGCGKQPYRATVERAGGDYRPYDRSRHTGGSGGNIGEATPGMWHDAILFTQVVQYVPDPHSLLRVHFRNLLQPGGALVMTYPSAWPVIRGELRHYTKLGMNELLAEAGYDVVKHKLRHSLVFDGFEIPVGYGVVARA